MSTTILRLIPTDPTFVPTATARQEATHRLIGLLPDAREIVATVHDDVTFVDQGTNFESVSCPVCGGRWAISWWQEAMDEAHRSQFSDLLVTAPCCGALVSLNDLWYELPAGFARFVLEAREPGRDLTDEQVTQLGAVVGCRLRQIWALS